MTDQEILSQALQAKKRRLEYLSGGLLVDTELTEEEKLEALERARRIEEAKRVFSDIQQKSREKRSEEMAQLNAEWGYERFYREMRDRSAAEGVNLVLNDSTLNLVKSICFLLSGDPRYETEMGFSFQKGLLIRGVPTEENPFGNGLGKSFIPGLVADNPISPVQMVSILEVNETIKTTGSWGSWNEKLDEYRGFKFGSFKFFYLDDLGTEDEVFYFGSRTVWFKNWFELFYQDHKEHIRRMIISTNLSFTEIEDKYGVRVRDRMAETFNVLNISGESFRRKKA